MLMNPPDPASFGPNLLTLTLPLRVSLRHTEERRIQTAAVVEVELGGLFQDGVAVDRGTEIRSAGGHSADDPRLRSQNDVAEDVLLGGHTGDAFRDPDAEVDHRVGTQFHCGAPRDHLAHRQLEWRYRGQRDAQLSAQRGGVLGPPGLWMVFGRGYDHAVDEHAWDLHVLRAQGSHVGDSFDLDDHQAAGVVDRGGDGEGLQEQRLALHGDVAVRVGGGTAQERDIEALERLVEQVLLAADGHQLDAVFGGVVVDLAAAVAWVDECVEADPREQPGLACGGIAEQLGDHTLRQVVGLDLAVDGHLAELARHAPVAADGPFEQTFVAQPVKAAALPISLCHRERQCQIPGRAGLQKPRLQRQGQLFGKALRGETLRHDGVAVTDQRDGFLGGHDLVARGQAGQGIAGKLHRFAPLRV